MIWLLKKKKKHRTHKSDVTSPKRANISGPCAPLSIQMKQENVYSAMLRKCPYVLMSSPRKQRLRSSPAHSWTPTMPKMKKTKKQRRRTFPSMGRVSNSRVTKIRIPSGAKNKKGHQKWWNYTIFCAQNKYRCFKLTYVTVEFCISCIGEPLTGPSG